MALYEKAKQLLYQLVVVETDVRQTKDFASSFLADGNIEQISTKDGKLNLAFNGYLKTIDPISHSVILCHLTGESIVDSLLILGRNIRDIRLSKILNRNSLTVCDFEQLVERDQQAKLRNHPYFCKPPTNQPLDPEELTLSQARIINWFNKYRVPIKLIEDTQELLVADCVRIKPPYLHESDYICPTRVILRRIKYMVDLTREPDEAGS